MAHKPPTGLSRGAKRLWTSIAEELDMDSAGVLVLNLLCESWDRREGARAEIAKSGAVFLDRFNQPKLSPHAAIERDATLQILRCFHALGLDLASEGGA
jgi:P27 family predicted phage terminase small subunit